MYNEIVTRLFQLPYHQERPSEFTTQGQAGAPGEGPFLTMYLTVTEDKIASAYFETYGCPSAVACGRFVCGWAEGKSAEQAGVLDAETLQKALGGLPLGKEHAAHLINALRKATVQMVTAEAS